MAEVVIYTTRFCPYCIQAKRLLDSKRVPYREIPVDGDAQLRAQMMAESGQRTVPQIWIGDEHVGGCDDLYMLERSHQLDSLLASQGIDAGRT